MKVALLTDGIWPYVIGGMQKHSYFLCKYLLKQGAEVLLFHTAKNITDGVRTADVFTAEERRNLEVITLEETKPQKFPGHYIYSSYSYSKEVYKALNQYSDIDFIIAKGFTGWYTLRNRKIKTSPVAINIHGYEYLQKNIGIKMRFNSLVLGSLLNSINRMADYVFSYGGNITEYIRQIGVPETKIIELPGAIEQDWTMDKVVPSGGRRKFVFVGRWERRKGFEELSTVIKRLLVSDDFEFHFVGPIEDKNRLISANLIYHGVVSDKDKLQQILQQAHVLVCPSYAEGMPNVIMEAMANGCAVIATNVGAVPLLVDESTGWLIEAGDIDGLFYAMQKAIRLTNDKIDIKRECALNKIKKQFLWENVGKQLFERIEKIISDRKYCGINKQLINDKKI